LYWIDYLAASASLPFAAHGHGAYFCLSLLDRFYQPNCTLEQAKALLRLCIQELKVRFVVNLPEFVVKVIDKQGITEISL
jgi:20S proteasome subunit beta 4